MIFCMIGSVSAAFWRSESASGTAQPRLGLRERFSAAKEKVFGPRKPKEYGLTFDQAIEQKKNKFQDWLRNHRQLRRSFTVTESDLRSLPLSSKIRNPGRYPWYEIYGVKPTAGKLQIVNPDPTNQLMNDIFKFWNKDIFRSASQDAQLNPSWWNFDLNR